MILNNLEISEFLLSLKKQLLNCLEKFKIHTILL